MSYSYQIHVDPGFVGHAMITLTGPAGSKTIGFYPKSVPIIVTDPAYTLGQVKNDEPHSGGAQIWHSSVMPITESQFSAINGYVSSKE